MTVLASAFFLLVVISSASLAASTGDPKRGEYVARLGGCHSCHTVIARKGNLLAGGLALNSTFGTFHVPNITPDRGTGIGGWSDEDFIRAMTEGVAPDGSHYYPAFPFTSYTRMTRQDLLDLKAYLDSLPPVANAVPPHDLGFPYNLRFALGFWKWMFFSAGPFKPDPENSTRWNRGAYLVTGPGHCGECHTPRNFIGAPDSDHPLAGTEKGPDGESVPNITPHPKHGIGRWSAAEVVELLKTGILPDGDLVDSPMDDVVDNDTSHWTEDDLKAAAEYLLSSPILGKSQ